MKLSDIKDDNGTSLQSYADDLMQKADAKGLTVVMIFAGDPDFLQSIQNIPVAAIPDVLNQMASQMRKQPKSFENRNELRNPTQKN